MEENASNIPTTTDSLTDKKLALELEKLQGEVKDLNKKWYRKPQYLAAILPTMLGLVSLTGLLLNGNFDTQAKKLQLERDRLAFENQKFEAKIKVTHDSLVEVNQALINNNDSLLGISNKLKDSIVLKDINETKNRDSLSKAITDLVSKLKSNQPNENKDRDFEKLLKLFEKAQSKIDELKMFRDRGKQELFLLHSEIMDRDNQIKFLSNFVDSLQNKLKQ